MAMAPSRADTEVGSSASGRSSFGVDVRYEVQVWSDGPFSGVSIRAAGCCRRTDDDNSDIPDRRNDESVVMTSLQGSGNGYPPPVRRLN